MIRAAALAAVLAGILVTAPATGAQALVPPPAPPAATYEDYLPGELDCTEGLIHYWTVYYQADFLGWDDDGMEVYTDWYEVRREDNPGYPTGDSPDSDCPNWRIADDGSWYNSDTTVPAIYPSALPLDPLPTTEVEEGEAKVGLAILWKVME